MRTYLFVGILIIFFSCNEKKENKTVHKPSIPYQVDLINNLDKTLDAFNLSEIADSIELIRLEMHPDYLYHETNISDLEITKEYIFLISQKCGLLQYTRKGKFIRQIGSIGRGPGEYRLIRSISVNEEKREIYAFSNSTEQLLKYSFDNEFLGCVFKTADLHDITNIQQLGKHFFMNNLPFCPESNDPNLIVNFSITDSSFKEIKRITDLSYSGREEEITARKRQHGDGWGNFYQSIDPIVCINKSFIDYLFGNCTTVNRMDTKLNVSPYCNLNIGKKIPFDILHYRPANWELFDYLFIADYYESPQYLFFDFGHKRKRYKARFNKKDGSISMLSKNIDLEEKFIGGHLACRRRTGEKLSFTDDISGLGKYEAQFKKEDKWYSVHPIYDLQDKIKIDSLQNAKVMSPNTRNKLLEILKENSDSGSPVLSIVHLKK